LRQESALRYQLDEAVGFWVRTVVFLIEENTISFNSVLLLCDNGYIVKLQYRLVGVLKLRKLFLQRLHRTSTIGAFVLAVLVVCVSVGLLSAAVTASEDQNTAVVGVKVGDWVKYKVIRLGPSGIWYGIWNNVVWIKFEVLNVSGITVTISETMHNTDGSESVENQSWNLPDDRPYNKRPLLTEFVMATTLGPGDKVGEYPFFENLTSNKSFYADLILNNTDYRDYGGVTREVNQLQFTWLLGEYPPYVRNYSLEQHWDKSTGSLLDEKMQSYLLGYKSYLSILMLQFADTNMWQIEKPPQQTMWWLATIPAGAIIIAAVTIKLSNNRKEKRDDIKN
jgi:hypothetical protein